MSIERESRNSNYAAYDLLTSDVLEMILRQDCDADGGDGALDIEETMYIAGVLADRRKKSDNPGKTAEEAFEDFKTYYLMTEDFVEEEAIERAVPKKTQRKELPRWVRYAATVAATIALVVIGSVTAKALGYDIWQSVYIWSEETFEFVKPDGMNEIPTSVTEYIENLTYEQVLKQRNVPAWMMPKSFPDEFSVQASYISETPYALLLAWEYSCGERTFLLSVNVYAECEPFKQEKTDNLLEIREINGVSYYIFENEGQYRAAWQFQNYECLIYGDLSYDEINEMLDSIER